MKGDRCIRCGVIEGSRDPEAEHVADMMTEDAEMKRVRRFCLADG